MSAPRRRQQNADQSGYPQPYSNLQQQSQQQHQYYGYAPVNMYPDAIMSQTQYALPHHQQQQHQFYTQQYVANPYQQGVNPNYDFVPQTGYAIPHNYVNPYQAVNYPVDETALLSQQMAQAHLQPETNDLLQPHSSQVSSPANAGSRTSPAGHLSPGGTSAAESPKPASGRQRLQNFIFPPPQGTSPKAEPLTAQTAEALHPTATTESKQPSARSSAASLPMKPQFAGAAPSYPPSSSASRPASGIGQRQPSRVPLGMNPIAAVRNSGLQGSSSGATVHQYGSSNRDFSAAQPCLNSQSSISQRYPVLPAVPPRAPSPVLQTDKSTDAVTKTYIDSLNAIIKAYEMRDDLLRLRTEAVGFQPMKAWTAWQKGESQQEDGETGQAEDQVEDLPKEDSHPILGVRLLQRIDVLSRENRELGLLLERKSQSKRAEPSESQEELKSLREEVADCHRLIASLDEALTKAESRAALAEKALEVACVNNSTAIVSTDAARTTSKNTSGRSTSKATSSNDSARPSQTISSPDSTPAAGKEGEPKSTKAQRGGGKGSSRSGAGSGGGGESGGRSGGQSGGRRGGRRPSAVGTGGGTGSGQGGASEHRRPSQSTGTSQQQNK